MNKIIYIISLFFSTLTFSQGNLIMGIIKDDKDNVPIESVSISILGTNKGTVSNGDGRFRIFVPEGFFKISFYHLGHEAKEYEIKGNEEVEIYLHPKEYVLNEVVINKNEGKEFLMQSIETSRNKIEKPVLLNTYYREFLKMDDNYTSFADGLIDFHIRKLAKPKKKINKYLDFDLCVKQSRVFDLRTPSDKEAFEGRISMNIQGSTINFAYNNYISILLGVLKASQFYNFQMETKIENNGSNICVIHIDPKKEKGKDNILAYYSGTVICDAEEKLILESDLNILPESVNKRINSKVIEFNKFLSQVKFKIVDGKYILSYLKTKCNVIWKKSVNDNESKHTTLEVVSYLTTLDYSEGEFKLPKIKKYEKQSLLLNGNSYTEEFWKNQNTVPLSEEEENIIKTLNQKSSSTAQDTIK